MRTTTLLGVHFIFSLLLNTLLFICAFNLKRYAHKVYEKKSGLLNVLLCTHIMKVKLMKNLPYTCTGSLSSAKLTLK